MVDSLRVELVGQTTEVTSLRQQLEAKQTRFDSLRQSNSYSQYEEIIRQLTARVAEEQAKQAEVEALARTISADIGRFQDMHRHLQPLSKAEWQTRRTTRYERTELKALQQERYILNISTRCLTSRFPLFMHLPYYTLQ